MSRPVLSILIGARMGKGYTCRVSMLGKRVRSTSMVRDGTYLVDQQEAEVKGNLIRGRLDEDA